MAKLHQILAVVNGIKSRVQSALTKSYHKFQNPGAFTGIYRTYSPDNEDGDELPPESTLVQLRADAIIAEIIDSHIELIDAVATQDKGNTVATADIIVNGKTLVTDVPVTTLIFLEKRLTDLATALAAVPTLPIDKTWEPLGDGTWRSISKKKRTAKVPFNHVLSPATDKHPAQVQVLQKDVALGTWTVADLSGAIPVDRKKKMIDNLHQLSDAVKQARAMANEALTENVKIGEQLLTFIIK